MKNDVREEISCKLVCRKNIHAWSTFPCEVPFNEKQDLLGICLRDRDVHVLFHARISYCQVLPVSSGREDH